jgi:hypothetical protein
MMWGDTAVQNGDMGASVNMSWNCNRTVLLTHGSLWECIHVIIWEPSNVAWETHIRTITTLSQQSIQLIPRPLQVITMKQSPPWLPLYQPGFGQLELSSHSIYVPMDINCGDWNTSACVSHQWSASVPSSEAVSW